MGYVFECSKCGNYLHTLQNHEGATHKGWDGKCNGVWRKPAPSIAEELAERLEAFMEPMRRYTNHAAWTKGDENMLIDAYNTARDVLARFRTAR